MKPSLGLRTWWSEEAQRHCLDHEAALFVMILFGDAVVLTVLIIFFVTVTSFTNWFSVQQVDTGMYYSPLPLA